MKTQHVFKKVFIIILSAMLFAACTKEGPQGPAGPQGEQGPTGSQGPKGDKGAAGTANVYYSNWISLTFTLADVYWRDTISAPRITQSVIDNGIVWVYATLSNKVLQVSYSFNPGDRFMSYIFWIGKIELFSSFDPSNFKYRILLFPEVYMPAGLVLHLI